MSEDAQKDLSYYGQEKNTATYNLTRMNLLLHGVRPEKMTIRNGDTLSQNWPEDPAHPNECVLFDAVVMNPPNSAKNWNKTGIKVSDPRFGFASVLPPDSKGDFAFLLHGLYHLGQNGTMAIVLPHGVLFRGSSEGEIRKKSLEKNRIDAIIGLPSNLFTDTGNPVCILVLKKDRAIGAPVLVIDASRSFVKVGKQNVLQEKDIAKVVDTYVNRANVKRAEIKGYCHLATLEKIIKNEYSTNIPRYVDAVDGEISQDVDGHLYGGIPQKNVDDLKILQLEVGNVLNSALSGYFILVKPISELTADVLNDSRVLEKSEKIKTKVEDFIVKYWNVLRKINAVSDINPMMEEMLTHIKEILSEFDFINVYDGYQIVAEIGKIH